jgi:Ser/Thr protein kinase RdoA (MazF antagonist)
MLNPSNVPSSDGIRASVASDSILRANFLIENVLTMYALDSIGRCRLHARGLNDTYRVETIGGEAYYLRLYCAGWRSRSAIETEIGMLLHLAKQNVKVSAPIGRIDGQFLTPLDGLEGRRWAVLFAAAPGKELARKRYTEELAFSYGATAAAILSAADNFEGARQRSAIDLEALLERPLQHVSSAMAQSSRRCSVPH